ncbi:MarR family winged helix-turn-helix transcriptional regulator [Goodfellowiella coeruleoviolacea]|nr:MarR family transcriptional regulator [Goodfellowiella coeruleoviolacea]
MDVAECGSEDPEVTCQEVRACAQHVDLNWLLHRVAQRLGNAMQAEAERHGIGIRGQLVLTALAQEQRRTQLALSHALGLDKTTMTSVLDRLEQSGLVVRKPDPNDRRVRLPELTEQGRALQAVVADALARVERGFVAGIDQADQERLRAVLLELAYGGHGEIPDNGSCL